MVSEIVCVKCGVKAYTACEYCKNPICSACEEHHSVECLEVLLKEQKALTEKEKKRADGLENKLRSPKYKELSKLIITHEHAECIDEVNRLHEGIKEIAKAPCEKCKKVQNDWEKKYRTEVFAGKDNSSRERRRAEKAEAKLNSIAHLQSKFASIADELESSYYVLNLYRQYLPIDTASSVDALKQLAKELRENGK